MWKKYSEVISMNFLKIFLKISVFTVAVTESTGSTLTSLKKCLEQKNSVWIILSMLLLILVSTVFLQNVKAETPQYWASVNLATPNNVMYSTVGHNLTISFHAAWTYGENIGLSIENANVTIEVETTTGTIIDTFNSTTNSTGFLLFNYSAQTPYILKFTPTKLFSKDGKEWNSTSPQSSDNVFGFQAESISVYYDTFDIKLVSTDTNSQGTTSLTVNVTYLLVPEEGLILPPSSSYLNQTYFPKIAHNVKVTVNGIKAQESDEPGMYTTRIPTSLPTAYVLVEVSQEEWLPNYRAFSFAHVFNLYLWMPIIAGIACVLGFLMFYNIRVRKRHAVGWNRNFPIFGGILLLGASLISLYWGVVGIDNTLDGFNWILLSILGLGSFVVGVIGSVMSVKYRHEARVLFVMCIPLLVNTVAVRLSLDMYELALPWITVILSFVISLISAILIGNSDDQFS